MLNITSGVINRAQKTVIYGPEGIGKTSLAAMHPEPLFIDTEGGTSHMNVRRLDKPETWEEMLGEVKEVAANPDVCKTLVIDTADWAEQLATTYICTKYKQNSIESFGYGKGYTYLGEEFARFLSACDLVIAAGINVVITAHAKMRKFEQPDEMGAYDRWEMKLSKQSAPLLKEWCDHLLFCNYQTFVVTSENDTKKVQGGKRVIYTTHHPAWDAKSRAKLPEVVDLDYENIKLIYSGDVVKTKSPLDELKEKLVEVSFTADDLITLMVERGRIKEAKTLKDIPTNLITGWVFKYWNEITQALTANSEQEEKNND